MLAFVVTAIPSLTASECALSFISANPDLRKFELYDTWFDDNSTTTLAQAGVYKGADDIKEYIKFVWASPYISANGFLHDQYSLVSSMKRSGAACSCLWSTAASRCPKSPITS